ncbi:helix-turn-helix transcriptional regulator [Aneurinibacillus thermoaerophilus]|uniref:helix-turn-helix domain-containing protein n=1 Tax=Aneurinibacillus thermoaerophilus TaxID=143495 RepID=UPI002E224D96|nr:helix-turn-helix transcriptional regulator [Aneurinibacillus thermoaerophilus]MED0763792.1 helix-turn-helix transcriptional regulator [Aneurinibacillus thermoaerophilus]
MDIRQSFGQRIKELRLRCGWTQEELAERSGLHPNYVGQVERGEKNISLENIAKLAHGLHVELSLLFQFEKHPVPAEQIRSLLEEFAEEDQFFVMRQVEEMARWMKQKRPSTRDM